MMINDIIKQIDSSQKILIVTHVSPDGDTTGAGLALTLALKQLKKDVRIAFEKFPDRLEFLPGRENAVLAADVKIEDFDLAIIEDTASKDRCCIQFENLSSIFTIGIDHHISNIGFCNLNYICPDAPATGEIMYEVIKGLGCKLNKEISECLYTAISSDTGGFRYSNTRPITHNIAADLLSHGIDVSKISDRLFETKSFKEIKLTMSALSNLEVFFSGKVAIIKVYDATLKELGATKEECEHIVNYARNLVGVNVGVMLREDEKNKVKASMRSNCDIDVAKIAAYFGGGGHIKAAGCTLNCSILEAQDKILDALRHQI